VFKVLRQLLRRGWPHWALRSGAGPALPAGRTAAAKDGIMCA